MLHWVVLGRTNREIAQELGIAEVTVKVHVGNVLQKLGASDRTEAATAGHPARHSPSRVVRVMTKRAGPEEKSLAYTKV